MTISSERGKPPGSPTPRTLAVTPEHLGVSLRVGEAIATAFEGDAPGAMAAADAIVDYAECAEPFSQAYARLFAGWATAVVDRPHEAVRHADAGLALCEQGGYRYLAQLIVPAHAWAVARCGGDAREQAARLAAAAAFLDLNAHHHALGQWYVLLAEVHGLAGDTEAALGALARAAEISERTGERVYAAQVSRVRATLAVASGR